MTTATESLVHARACEDSHRDAKECVKLATDCGVLSWTYHHLTPAQARSLIAEIEAALEAIKE